MDDLGRLFEFLQQIYPVEAAVLTAYVEEWEPLELPKRAIMTSPGQIESHLYFVLEGAQKSYHLEEGKQHIIAFAYAPGFSGVPDSFLSQSPSMHYLETISPSRFLRIPYAMHNRYINEHRGLETMMRKTVEQLLVGVLRRQHELMAYDMEKRFTVFMARSKHLLQLVAHKDLAAYLRMDPTNFSKLLSRYQN